MKRLAILAIVVMPALLFAVPVGGDRAQLTLEPLAPSIRLVPPVWVAAHADDRDVRILDVRRDMHDYFAGHVRNAVYLPDSNLRAPREGLPVQYLPPADMARILQHAGVTRSQRIVVYSDREDVVGATLVAYLLERLDFPHIYLMDGGWSTFQATLPSSRTYPRYTEETLPARYNLKGRASLEAVTASIGDPGVRFIDARPDRMYFGWDATWMRNGHIPGAINIEWRQFVDRDNPHRVRPLEEIRTMVQARGIRNADRIVVYCGTSREASLVYVVLKHFLGFPNVTLFEGSWTEYAAHPELPIERSEYRAINP